MLIHINGIRLALDEGEGLLAERAAAALSLPVETLSSLKIIRRSLDARRERPPFFVYSLELELPDDVILPEAAEGVDLSVAERGDVSISPDGLRGDSALPEGRQNGRARPWEKIVVLGSGPAGMFAALHLARNGFPVRILERGRAVPDRCRDVQAFWEHGELNRESNVHFGEGGAGTFSDGKLTSRSRNPQVVQVKETLVELGAERDILIEAKPHIGTDALRRVAVNFREKLIALGCEVRFGARVSDFLVEEGRLTGVQVNDGEEIMADRLILAPGQHADDTYARLRARGVLLLPKPFAMGLRVEHPQSQINRIQYGKWRSHPALPPAEYFLTAKTRGGRSVYSFCMCPGGRIIGCASEPGGVITNGMSNSRRDGPHANSALVVNVRTEDFSDCRPDPLRGLAFRRVWEKRAFDLGGGDYRAPAQRLADFVRGRKSGPLPETSFQPGVRSAALARALPSFVAEALREGLLLFEKKMPGFIAEEAVLVGVETRTSSPVRIVRGEDGQSVSTKGLYPCGEGAGYAGGIVSSALDGIRAAQKVIDSLDMSRYL